MHRWRECILASRPVAVCGLLLAIPAAAQTRPDSGTAPYRRVVDQYCLGCHNTAAKTAGVDLESLAGAAVSHDAEGWERVVRKLRGRQMPPVGMPKPSEAEYRAALGSLTEELDDFASSEPNPGRTPTFRRLNRTEYRNAIRDLLALDVNVDDLLPSDEASHGFDNITVSDLPPLLLERMFPPPRKSLAWRWPSRAAARRRHGPAAARPDPGAAHSRPAAGHARRRLGAAHVPR